MYILASKRNGTLYIGMTSNLQKRVWEHKQKVEEGFTREYGVDRLVYFEQTNDPIAATTRERQMKKMEACMEDCINRGGESYVEGFV